MPLLYVIIEGFHSFHLQGTGRWLGYLGQHVAGSQQEHFDPRAVRDLQAYRLVVQMLGPKRYQGEEVNVKYQMKKAAGL